MGQVGWVVVGGVLGGNQANPVGHGGQRRQQGLCVGPAGNVKVVDLSEMFAQTQSFTQEEGGEDPAFRGLDEPAEGFEVRLRARLRGFPDGSGVDALKEDA